MKSRRPSDRKACPSTSVPANLFFCCRHRSGGTVRSETAHLNNPTSPGRPVFVGLPRSTRCSFKQVPIPAQLWTARHPWALGHTLGHEMGVSRASLWHRPGPAEKETRGSPSLLGQRCDATRGSKRSRGLGTEHGPPCTVPGRPGKKVCSNSPTGGSQKKKVTPWASIWHFHRDSQAMSHPFFITRPSPRSPSGLPPGIYIIFSPHLATGSGFLSTSEPITSLATYTLEGLPRSSRTLPSTSLVHDSQPIQNYTSPRRPPPELPQHCESKTRTLHISTRTIF